MKSKIVLMILAVAGLMLSNAIVYGQNSNTSGKIKSRIAHVEKIEKGKKSTAIDSEEKYDLKGNVTEEIEYKGGKIDKHMVYEYDSNNNKIRETELDGSGKPIKIGEYKYENGLRTEKYIYDGNKKLHSRKYYTYSY